MALALSANVMSSPVPTAMSVPPVALPADKTSAKVSVTPGSTPARASTTAAPLPDPVK